MFIKTIYSYVMLCNLGSLSYAESFGMDYTSEHEQLVALENERLKIENPIDQIMIKDSEGHLIFVDTSGMFIVEKTVYEILLERNLINFETSSMSTLCTKTLDN